LIKFKLPRPEIPNQYEAVSDLGYVNYDAYLVYSSSECIASFMVFFWWGGRAFIVGIYIISKN
jgi:hypothetical protein